jgi:hypothetical protein
MTVNKLMRHRALNLDPALALENSSKIKIKSTSKKNGIVRTVQSVC